MFLTRLGSVVVDVYDLIIMSSTGTRVEGILRQSADVEEVDSRVRDYEQGNNIVRHCFLLSSTLHLNHQHLIFLPYISVTILS